ncbi:MAG: hypothetical protein KA734_07715 [Fluviicola sp.]|nr:hypothetical protein [Fluviicola sp.]
MLRIFLPLIFIILFFGWMAYRLFIKKDLKNKKETVLIGFSFLAVWVLIYFLIIG